MSETETIDETRADEAPATRQALTIAPSRLPMSAAIAKEYDIDKTQWRVLVEQTFPSAKTIEAVLMALSYCRARNLDIFKKPVHIVPMWSSELGRMVETVWPGIAEIRTTAARTGEYAGIDEVVFGPMLERKFTGTVGRGQRAETVTKTVKFPEWASVIVYRLVKGQRFAFHTKIFWEETYASIGKSDVPNDMWEKRPRGQFDKCVEAAGLRKAFPEEVGSMYAAEEMEGRIIEGAATPVPPERPTPPAPPPEDEPPVSQNAASNDGPKGDTPADKADDFTDDSSEFVDVNPTPGSPEELDAYLTRVDEELAALSTEAEVVAHYEALGVDDALLSLGEAIQDRAAAIRSKHLDRVTTDDMFPGDRPLPKAAKIAGTP